MSKPFNIHDWQAKQRQQRLEERRAVPSDRDDAISLAPSKTNKGDKAIDKDEKIRDIKEENPVVAKGDGIEITQDEMDKLHKNGRVRLKDGSLLVFPSKPLKVKEENINESLNPEVSRKVDSFIKAMAKRYDYSEQDAIFAIMAALKQRNMDEANMTGTGASFNAGSGEGYMTPNAFKKKKKK